MTSQPTREDLEQALADRGLSWGEVVKMMRVIDLYVVARVHQALGREEIPPEEPRAAPKDRRKYKCRICRLTKPAADFPEVKRENPRLSIPCSYCTSAAGWR